MPPTQPAPMRRVVVLMHRWVGYLHGVQLGIADYALQRPDWLLAHVPPEQASLEGLKKLRVHGVVAYVERGYLQPLIDKKVPVVDISNWLPESPFPRVLPDDDAIGRMAAEYLLDLGLRHLATIGYAHADFYRIRRDAFVAVCQKAGITANVYSEHVKYGQPPSTPVLVDPNVLAWVHQLPKPVGIFCCNDVFASDLLETCRRAAIRVPEDVCVLGVDNDELLSRMTHPPLSSISLHTQKIGFESARLLDDLMNGRPVGETPVRLPPVGVVARQSTNLLAIEDEDVLAAVRYIRDNVHRQVTVGMLLRVVPVNRRFLERRFKQHLGRTPLQEIRRVRIEKAKELLSGTDLSMPAVAKRSGFPNPERLANVFHATVGMTPTAYRRKFRLNDF